MKVKQTNYLLKTLVAGGMILAVAGGSTLAAGPEALELIKLGDPYVGIQSKDKVVQIRSEKSIASLTPDIWYVVYYDPDATFRAVEVKFGAGEKLDVSHPGRVLEWFGDAKDPLDPTKLNIDSERAIKIAASKPLLKNLTLKASQLTLGHSDMGPVWKVRLWAAKLNNPDKQADIGLITLSAADGSIIKSDLRPDRVD